MKIGCPKEIKPQEGRVGLTPAGVDALVRAGHQVFVERNAGIDSGFTDAEYTAVGATICASLSLQVLQTLSLIPIESAVGSFVTFQSEYL